MKNATTTNLAAASFSAVGMAAMLPGMQHMLTLMQAELDRMRDLIGAASGPQVKYGRPPGKSPGSSWAGMTAKQRSKEMQRRLLVRKGLAPPRGKKAKAKAALAEAAPTGKLHVRDLRHPEHAAWAARIKKAKKKQWSSMTVRQRKEWQDKMQAGKRGKAKVKPQHPVAALAPNGKVAHA